MSDTTRLAIGIRLYMASNMESARSLAPRIGMSHTTLSRFLQGEEVSTKHFMSLLNYLMGTNHPPGEEL